MSDRPVSDGLREALAEDAALLHHYVHPDVSFEECDGARCVRRRAALAATPDNAGRSPIDAKYRAFVGRAAAEMERRLEHGRAKFGSDWDEEPYPDDRNEQRIRRAVDHLIAARANSPDPEEWRKRAADVANQAFMYADPARLSESTGSEEGR